MSRHRKHSRSRMTIIALGMATAVSYFFASGGSSLLAGDRVTGREFGTRSEVIASHAMAATSHPLATQIALDVMRDGGNAVDAAIAANAALGLMEPVSNGIGGDLFAIVWNAETQTLHGLNASGRSPKSLTLEELRRNDPKKISATGPLPVSVPGCVDGWFELHERFGRLPMARVLDPAIGYAREGFPVTELIAYYWASGKSLAKFPGFSETFLPGGKAPSKGEIFKNPRLAKTLEAIRDGGREVFYRGEIARVIDRYMKDNGGFLSYDDLASHTSEWVKPLSTNYRGYDVWELPPNGQGIAALQMLNVLEGDSFATDEFGSVHHLHRLIEAKKLAFEDRAKFYSDPVFNDLPIEGLISKAYAKERRELIQERAAKRYDAGNPALYQGDTIYLTVADADRNMVSLIQSNYRGFGSGMCPTDLGFCLQDRGELFDLRDGQFNTYAPGKRPFHTIIPAFITKDGKPWASFGLMGGDMQPQGHVQIVMNLIDFGMNLQEAGDAPRMRHAGSSSPTGQVMASSGVVSLETGIDYEVVRELIKRGHTVQFDVGNYGGYQAIRYDSDNDVYLGASESRKDGQAAGF